MSEVEKYPVVKGHCPICGDQFFDVCSACGRAGAALPNHRQLRAQLSNGHESYLGVCEKHTNEMTLPIANAIWLGVADYMAAENGLEMADAKVIAIGALESASA
jgi:hypothetical protein